MSAGMSVPEPRAPVCELRLVVPTSEPDDEIVVLACGGCDRELRHTLEPVTPLLDAVSEFVREHTACGPGHRIARLGG